jgi:hypothetical protein
VIASDLLRRLERVTLIVLGVMAAAALVVRPQTPRLALGILGGGALIGIAYRAISGVAGGLAVRAISGENPSISRTWALVKFFTRHAILALAGYVMMARLELHPVGMLLGVTAPALALTFEVTAGRLLRRP